MRNKAFTLIELLVVIAIIGILSSVIYTNITGIRDRARITAGIRFDSSTLHSIGDQLVGEWTFDSPNLPLIDTSGFGNVGTCTTCPTYATTSGYNNKGAYDFTSGTTISCGSNAILNSTSYTLSAWFNTTAESPDDTSGRRLFVLYETVGSTKITLMLRNNRPEVLWKTPGGSAVELSTNIVANDGAWHNLTATTDGTVFKVYLDGVLKNTNLSSSMKTTFNSCYIGMLHIGLIDDVRIYQSILSSSDIQKLYADGKTSHEVAAN
ncbi:MAG: LamG-like jellyroll fold domain-containing protein [Candidatus Paceibacterota bacterium]|jgi:prepilin-type N-terminal cleavage/methylation domain-containing protein